MSAGLLQDGSLCNAYLTETGRPVTCPGAGSPTTIIPPKKEAGPWTKTAECPAKGALSSGLTQEALAERSGYSADSVAGVGIRGADGVAGGKLASWARS